MRRDTRKALNLTAEYAARALHFLIADGKLALRDVSTALSRRKKLIKELKDRFTALETSRIGRTAKARKAAPRKPARSRRRTAVRRAGQTRRALPKAARAKAGARSTAKAPAKVTGKKTAARSAGSKATTRTATKATTTKKPTRRPGTGMRPGTVGARTRKPDSTAATAATTETQRPVVDTQSIPAPAPTPSTEGRRSPRVVHPEREGGGPAPRGWNQV